MRTLNWLFAIGLLVGMSACGDDDDGTTPGMDAGGGGTDSGGGGTDSGGGGTDSGGGGTDSGMTMMDDAGGGDDAGTMDDAGMMMGSEAEMFCARYETACTFMGMSRYDDSDECVSEYEDANEGCVTCIEMHLMNVEGAPAGMEEEYANLHCPHATTTASNMAMGPCAGPCM